MKAMTYCMKRHLTREEKRRIQRQEAIAEGVIAIVILVAVGFAAGLMV